MENSIENTWKKGFLKENALVVPKLNNLYEQKSKSLVDRMQRMFVINLWMVSFMAVAALLLFIFIGVPWLGLVMFLLLGFLVLVGIRAMKKSPELDHTLSSYEHLITFDKWLKSVIAMYTNIYRVLYPAFLLSVVFGVWYSSMHEKLVERVLSFNPDTLMIAGMPAVIWGVTLVASAVVSYFAKAIYMLDLKIAFGHVFRKLEDMIREMEELRA